MWAAVKVNRMTTRVAGDWKGKQWPNKAESKTERKGLISLTLCWISTIFCPRFELSLCPKEKLWAIHFQFVTNGGFLQGKLPSKSLLKRFVYMLIKFLSNDRYFKYIKPTLYSIRIPLRRVLFFFLIVKGQAFFLWLFTDWKLYIWKILAVNIVSDE